MLIHEMSHFSNIAGTVDGDKPYSLHILKDWALYIAKTNPAAAIHNAYSYQHYAQELSQQQPKKKKKKEKKRPWWWFW